MRSWPPGLSTSANRAMAMFNLPDAGRSTAQENKGKVDKRLRKAVAAAEKVFWKIYMPKKGRT